MVIVLEYGNISTYKLKSYCCNLNLLSEDPITISTSMYIQDIHFCSKRQTLTVGGYFRQKWVDRRLQASKKPEEKGLVCNFSINPISLKFHDVMWYAILYDNNTVVQPDLR